MKNKIKKYLPDILINLGIWIFFYVKYFPIRKGIILPIKIGLEYDYSNHFKFIGIILITLGINIAIRLYFKKYAKIK